MHDPAADAEQARQHAAGRADREQPRIEPEEHAPPARMPSEPRRPGFRAWPR